MRDRVTVVRRTEIGQDRYGNAEFAWTDVAEYRGRLIYPSGSEETTRRDAQKFGAAVILPPGADVNGRDRLRVWQSVWEVDGPPLPQRQAFGPGLLKVRVKAWEG
jgi:hypothetical protein